MDGFLRLTDVRHPEADSVFSTRYRFGSSAIAYCDQAKAVFTNDENNSIRAFPFRRFFSNANLGRHTSHVLSLAFGHVHPVMLVGGADGSVMASNPMRKFTNWKYKVYQQIWFKHEWARKDGGISRFLEGFKVDQPPLLRTKWENGASVVGEMTETVYEEETGVNAVAWNPNGTCGGWAAAAMNCGLLRIEDIAL